MKSMQQNVYLHLPERSKDYVNVKHWFCAKKKQGRVWTITKLEGKLVSLENNAHLK